MAGRKIFKETFPHAKDRPARPVLRTHAEFFFGLWEIVCGLADQAFALDRPEQLLSIGRRQALRMTKDALQARGYALEEVDPHDIILSPKSITPKRFIGKLTDHVRLLFPELVA